METIFKLKQSKKDPDKVIAYSEDGMAVIIKNQHEVRVGFGTIRKILTEKENYILVEMNQLKETADGNHIIVSKR